MAIDAKVAKRYARALFQAAQKGGVIESVEADLNAISHLSATHEEFRGFMSNPRIGREDKVKIAEKLFSDRITALSMNLLRLLLTKRREREFEQIREDFINFRREEGNVVFAFVTTAQELTQAEKDAIINKIAAQTGKTVEADYAIDPTLIGGVKIGLGNYLLDGTVRGSLNRLRDKWKYDLLKQN